MASIAVNRLMEERKQWRKEKNSPHFEGFEAGPMRGEDGSSNWMVWHCYIPGKQATVWEGAKFKLRFEFPEDYPAMPPKCKFEPVIFHPNIYPSVGLFFSRALCVVAAATNRTRRAPCACRFSTGRRTGDRRLASPRSWQAFRTCWTTYALSPPSLTML